MATLRELLKLSPKEAARAIVAKAMRTGHDVDNLELSPSDGLSTTRSFTINLSQRIGDVRKWRYKGTTSFTYDRLLWSDVFGETALSLNIDAPATMEGITDYIQKRFGITFDQNDVMPGPINLTEHGTVTMMAQPQSWRWFGTQVVYFKGVPESEAVIKAPPAVEDVYTQVANPTAAGMGELLVKLRRGQILGFNGRVWWNAANVAFGMPKKWVIDKVTPSPYNAGGAMVIFNGVALDAPEHLNLGPNPRKVQIALHRNLCTNLKGLVTIYYSKP